MAAAQDIQPAFMTTSATPHLGTLCWGSFCCIAALLPLTLLGT